MEPQPERQKQPSVAAAAVKQRIADRILEEIVVAPEVVNKFAALNKYASLAQPSVNKFAALDRFASLGGGGAGGGGGGKFAAAAGAGSPRKGNGRKRRMIRRTTAFLPPIRAVGELLTTASSEYERAFEWEINRGWFWTLGDVIDFDHAAGSQSYQCDEDDDPRVWAWPVESEAKTFHPGGWADYDDDDVDWPAMMAQAMALRQELAADPQQVLQVLEVADLTTLADLVGLSTVPGHHEVAEAIAADSNFGLGAAALDYAVWRMPGRCGYAGEQFGEVLELLDRYTRLWPVENFLFHSGSLHPQTVKVEHDDDPDGPLHYPMHGDYVVAKIGYHSDLTGKVICGWRSVYLEPDKISQYPIKREDME